MKNIMITIVVLLLALALNYITSYRHGKSNTWYPNNKVASQGEYRYGVACGDYREFHENGDIKEYTKHVSCDSVKEPRGLGDPYRLKYF